MHTQLGQDVVRKEAASKVTGAAKYTNDLPDAPLLHAKLLTSPHAHAHIASLDTSAAAAMPGVKAVITAQDRSLLCGALLRDTPPLAKVKVRYRGEPVAMVVANDEQQALAAITQITVVYEPLPVVNSLREALKKHPVLIHENLSSYIKMIQEVYPIAGTNICHQQKIRKGDMERGWAASNTVVEGSFSLPQSAHAAMETRTARCQAMPDGRLLIKTSSQAPFAVREQISGYFNIPEGNIIVHTPLVGGGFGGKASAQLEVLAVLAALAVPGSCVNLANTREQDIASSPCHLGLEASIKLGANKEGKLIAAEMTFHIDTGAYAEISPKLAKSMAVDCTGPYFIPHIHCDCYSVYTNHQYATSYRGFGHEELTFCLERMLDKLAQALGMDALQFRLLNCAQEGDLQPTLTKTTLSNCGDISQCLHKLGALINWDEGPRLEAGNNLVRAKGVGCFLKTSDSPTDAGAGALITFNADGSLNLDFGAVEIGPGIKTAAAQILAEKMRMSVNDVYVKLEVDTQSTPKHWKTVASMTMYLVGRAVINAADDLLQQILGLAAIALRCQPEDLDFTDKTVFAKHNPDYYIGFQSLAQGYKYPDGNAIKGPLIGRGSFIMPHLTTLDKATGRGKAGSSWTVGAQAVEIEYDTVQHTYRLLKAATVIDAGRVINPKTAKGVIMGGMCMGLGLGCCEDFTYDENGLLENTSFRTYKMLRCGENPQYLVEFVETPQIDAPFGARGIAEHGIIAIPAALANALSRAARIDVQQLPISPEYIWKEKTRL